MLFQLNDNITMYNLNDIADQLKDTADKIPSNSELSDVRTSLKNQALHLKSYQENLVQPMTDGTVEMKMLAIKFDETLKFNRTNFEEAINELREEILNAQKFIQEEGTVFVREVSYSIWASWTSLYMYNLLLAGCSTITDQLHGRDHIIFDARD